MSLHQGTPRIVIAMSHLHRLGSMTRVHTHMSLHQGTLRTVIDIHPRGIIIAIDHFMTVIDTAMVMPQGEQLHKRQGRRHMRRPHMVIHQDTRWWQVNIKRTLIIWSLPLLMPPPYWLTPRRQVQLSHASNATKRVITIGSAPTSFAYFAMAKDTTTWNATIA